MTITAVRATRPSPLTDRRACQVLVGAVVAFAIPYAFFGPTFILDDRVFLRNANFDGVFAAGGHNQLVARPIAWLLYAFQFGLIGAHPLVLYAIQIAANAVVAVALFLVLRGFLERRMAFAIAGLWVLLPSHTALSRWFATLPAVVALLLLLIGIDRLRASTDSERWPVAALLCFVAAGLAYEAVLPAAMVSLVAIPMLRQRRLRATVLIPMGSVLVLGAVWSWSHRLYTHDVTGESLAIIFPVHFGEGISWTQGIGVLLAVGAGLAIVCALLRVIVPELRPEKGPGEPLIVVGLVVIVVGSAAFLHWPWTMTGINDRANVVAAIGGAMVWVGIGMMAWRARRALFVAGVTLLLVAALPTQLQRDLDYSRAGDDATRILALTDAIGNPSGPIVVWPEPSRHHGVYALLDWMMSDAVQLHRNDPNIEAHLLPASPAFEAVFRAVPENNRVFLPR